MCMICAPNYRSSITVKIYQKPRERKISSIFVFNHSARYQLFIHCINLARRPLLSRYCFAFKHCITHPPWKKWSNFNMLHNEWPMLAVFLQLAAPRTSQPFVTLFWAVSMQSWAYVIGISSSWLQPFSGMSAKLGTFSHLSVLKTLKKFHYRFYSLLKVKFAAMTFFLLAHTGR